MRDKICEALGWEYTATEVCQGGPYYTPSQVSRPGGWSIYEYIYIPALMDIPLDTIPLVLASGTLPVQGFFMGDSFFPDVVVPYLSKRMELGI